MRAFMVSVAFISFIKNTVGYTSFLAKCFLTSTYYEKHCFPGKLAFLTLILLLGKLEMWLILGNMELVGGDTLLLLRSHHVLQLPEGRNFYHKNLIRKTNICLTTILSLKHETPPFE